MKKEIKPDDQMLVIEKLYRSNDSISSTERFNDEFGSSIGKIGIETIYLDDFYIMLKKANFIRERIKKFIKEITGEEITLY
ncbi:hypothetical protein ISR92_01255 [Patescibacteria group bacterium]|nr:hypothetical protein [Patescibacteria group bacterium]